MGNSRYDKNGKVVIREETDNNNDDNSNDNNNKRIIVIIIITIIIIIMIKNMNKINTKKDKRIIITRIRIKMT